ncbi:DUF6348 family protein [Pseudomonas purpurea]|uniref:DUF6348 family protein n=1 Tax=Pseudomonas purpurea TaxID=3136737 RepID=UPI003263BA3F
MTEINTQDVLRNIMTEHGLDCGVEDDWLLPEGRLPAIRAYWYPGEALGRLDIQVFIEPNVIIEECFAGFGEGDEAFGDALRRFMDNSLHVFLSAFWGKTDDDQVLIENLYIGEKKYVAYFGNIGIRSSAGVDVSPPSEVFGLIKTVLERETTSDRVNWCRTYCGNVKGSYTYEALLNNEVWPRGVDALQKIQWPETDGFYSFRHFCVCVAA